MANKFTIDDCVVLNSSLEPIMSIEDDSHAPKYYDCVWWDNKDRKHKREIFPENLLRKVVCPDNTPLDNQFIQG